VEASEIRPFVAEDDVVALLLLLSWFSMALPLNSLGFFDVSKVVFFEVVVSHHDLFALQPRSFSVFLVSSRFLMLYKV
jgi:hypothetical protein